MHLLHLPLRRDLRSRQTRLGPRWEKKETGRKWVLTILEPTPNLSCFPLGLCRGQGHQEK